MRPEKAAKALEASAKIVLYSGASIGMFSRPAFLFDFQMRKQFTERQSQPNGDPVEALQRWIAAAPLDVGNIGAVQPAARGEFLLGKALRAALLAHGFAEKFRQ